MKVKPIPSELLTDSITLLTPTDTGYSEEELSGVRVIRTSAVTDYLTSHARDKSELLVYFDCENSSPSGTEFIAGQSVEYCGETYEIVESTLFSADAPHHYRIRCRKVSGERETLEG